MKYGIRFKGGVKHDNGQWYALIHSWDNLECHGEPTEFLHPKSFDNELDALAHYITVVQPIIKEMLETHTDKEVTHEKINELIRPYPPS